MTWANQYEQYEGSFHAVSSIEMMVKDAFGTSTTATAI